jgi:hypothetical protein
VTCLEQSGGVPIAFMAAAVWIIRLPKATASASLAKSKSGARLVERVRSGTARAKATGTKSGKAFGRPRVSAETEQRIRDALASPRPRLPQDRGAVRRSDGNGATDRARVRLAGEMQANTAGRYA